MRRVAVVVVCIGVVLVGAIGDAWGAPLRARLTITTDTGTSAATLVRSRATLRCDGSTSATGFLRTSARRACRAVQGGAVDRVVAAHRRRRLCTQLYGGPQRGRITGTVGGRKVDLTVTRTDGCGVADWDALKNLLGDPEHVPTTTT
jgi:hypothetical protein